MGGEKGTRKQLTETPGTYGAAQSLDQKHRQHALEPLQRYRWAAPGLCVCLLPGYTAPGVRDGATRMCSQRGAGKARRRRVGRPPAYLNALNVPDLLLKLWTWGSHTLG